MTIALADVLPTPETEDVSLNVLTALAVVEPAPVVVAVALCVASAVVVPEPTTGDVPYSV
jgi:hypothetical protein